jgi:serine/threonine protein kinase
MREVRMPADHYKTLHCDPGAAPEVISASYKALAKLYKDDDAKLNLISLAHDVVGNEKKRREYDETRKPKGKVVGEYRMIEKLAEGGFGETWKVQHTALGSFACLKYALELTPDDEAMLIEEAKLMWDLRHYSIPTIKALVKMPDTKLGLVMSYVNGMTLAQLIERHFPNGMEPEHVAWITERCLNALKYMHHHGIVHGDMKPQNVMVEADTHTVVVVDYGLSRFKPKAGSGAKGYTPYFCAPEQEDFRTPIPETDLYGLGMTMIFALGGDVAAINVPPSTPPAMRDFIKSLIRRDPMKRPRVWKEIDLCETIKEVRQKDFGRTASGMKPLI